MILSKTCMYGLRAALYVAMESKEREYIPIREISEKLDISFHFLTKILRILTQNQIMSSFRGPNGGIKLARPPDQISLKDIIVAIDGPALFTECILGLPGCGEERPCPLHDEWEVLKDRLEQTLANATLEKTSDEIKQFHLRLSDSI